MDMEDRKRLSYLQSTLDSFVGFEPVGTIPSFSFYLLYTLVLFTIAIRSAAVHQDDCREYFLTIYMHIFFWVFTFIIHLGIKYIHYRIRLNGYLEFYKNTEVDTSLPIIVVSLWTVLLLFVQTLMQQYYSDDLAEICTKGGTKSPNFYVCTLITVEFCIIVVINIIYILKAQDFNSENSPREIEKEEDPDSEIFNYYRGGKRRKLYNFLEKQADFIKNLKEQNARLSENVMELSAQMQLISDGGGEAS